ncbi:hypothetical protein EYZ11_008823 [Aspergillus tanneri]|uniref:Uncharacterized protein n=1 Tax=Aspergillus tanneri TaxID=1220188 RepID=A0A4S3J9N0_9EURO|nr:uncharacterized protein ATNIH1004_004415 [Aspergillus tanneri]KAA8648530.1 hypothetical protein ATNIH1004_004415 [Aspergillus tanneri]THC91720.1 hypothetical protein EYZ11_008823 [Aspergillus tanneri]
MGQNVSAINGVRSDNYYKPGNAINEIWIGDVELISRLPFGDSDIAQAGWSNGGWPKVPWHNFIIPMKRSTPPPPPEIVITTKPGKTDEDVSATCDGGDGGDDGDGGDGEDGGHSGYFSEGALSDVGHIALMGALSMASAASFQVPMYLRHSPEPSSLALESQQKKNRYYITRAGIATLSLAVCLASSIFNVHFIIRFHPSESLRLWLVPVFLVLCGFGFAWGMFVQLKAIVPLWKDWRRVRREGDLEMVHR